MTTPGRIPINDLARGIETLAVELDAAARRVIRSGWYVLGPENAALSQELSAYLGVPHTVLVANGTEALSLAMLALGVGPGGSVLTAANAGGYAATAARAVGAGVRWADVDESSLLVTTRTLQDALENGPVPDVIVVTHLFGAAADMPSIMRWADERGIKVIEDCAQSLGAVIDGRHTGTFGHAATTSFYPTKNLGALGDAGAVFTNDAQVAELVQALRQYGWRSKYEVGMTGGMNSRLDEMQASFLRLKLAYLDRWNMQRRAIHARYEEAAPRVRFVNTANETFVAHLAVVDVADRDRARAHFDALGIGTDIHYPIPDHRQAAWFDAATHLPVSEAAASRVLSLPMFPELREDEVARVSDALATVPA